MTDWRGTPTSGPEAQRRGPATGRSAASAQREPAAAPGWRSPETLTTIAVCPKTDNQQSLIWSRTAAMARNARKMSSATVGARPRKVRAATGIPMARRFLVSRATNRLICLLFVEPRPSKLVTLRDHPASRSAPLTVPGAAVAALMLTAAVSTAEPAVSAAGADADAFGQAPTVIAAAAHTDSEPQTAPQGSPAPDDMVPRWLEAVRAQRRALQERRRAQHQARRRALDPVGTARQEAMEEEFQRRRQEMRDMIAQDRWLFLNFGPWLSPLRTPPGMSPPRGLAAPDRPPDPADDTERSPSADDPPEWDNGWYFRGW